MTLSEYHSSYLLENVAIPLIILALFSDLPTFILSKISDKNVLVEVGNGIYKYQVKVKASHSFIRLIASIIAVIIGIYLLIVHVLSLFELLDYVTYEGSMILAMLWDIIITFFIFLLFLAFEIAMVIYPIMELKEKHVVGLRYIYNFTNKDEINMYLNQEIFYPCPSLKIRIFPRISFFLKMA